MGLLAPASTSCRGSGVIQQADRAYLARVQAQSLRSAYTGVERFEQTC